MEINENSPNIDAWLHFLGVKDKPQWIRLYFDLRPDGTMELTLYGRNEGGPKYRRDYVGIMGVKQLGDTRLATETVDEFDWDKFHDEVWVSGL